MTKQIGNGINIEPWTANANLSTMNPGNDAWSSWSTDQLVTAAQWSGVTGDATRATFAFAVGAVSGENSTCLFEIGIDHTGGTSYTTLATVLVGGKVGYAANLAVPQPITLDIAIPNGATLSWRASRRQYVARLVTVSCILSCEVPGLVRSGTPYTIGANAPGSSLYATAIAAGNATLGAWTLVGQAPEVLFQVLPLISNDNNNYTNISYKVDLAIGSTSSPASITETFNGVIFGVMSAAEANNNATPSSYIEIAKNAYIFARISASGAPPLALTVAVLAAGNAAPIGAPRGRVPEVDMSAIEVGSTANVMVLMLDAGDSKTGKTGLAGSLVVSLSKDGAAFATVTPTITERGTGSYSLALSGTDTNTVGELNGKVTAAGADPVDFKITVVPKRLNATTALTVGGQTAAGILRRLAFAVWGKRTGQNGPTLTVFDDDTVPVANLSQAINVDGSTADKPTVLLDP